MKKNDLLVNTVLLQVQDYIDLVQAEEKYNNLIELISNCVRLNWDGKALTLFETDVLMKYLTSVEPVKFKNKLSMLQEEVKEKETKDEIPF